MDLKSAGTHAHRITGVMGTRTPPKETGADGENDLDTTVEMFPIGKAHILPLVPPLTDYPEAATASTSMELSSLLMDLEAHMKVEPGNEAYLEALCNAPAVVKAEADPTQFLRRDDMNVSAAARRMCNYWNLRKETFAERFTSPLLDLSGNGALSQATIDAMTSSGAAVVVISQDLDEIMALADRIAVIAGGRLSPAIPVAEATIETIGRLMGGASQAAMMEAAHAP